MEELYRLGYGNTAFSICPFFFHWTGIATLTGMQPHQYPNLSALGLSYMLLACTLFAVMANCVYAASLTQPPVDAAAVSFIRLGVNLSFLVLPALWARDQSDLFGDWRASLWLRGLFGGVSLILSFCSIQLIGPGESTFLSSSSGIFVATLSPWLLGQRNSRSNWLAILGAMTGMFLLFQPQADATHISGRLMGIGSGFLAALAYLMIARAGRSNPPRTIVFYFCLVGMMVHGAWFAWQGFQLPMGREGWLWTLAAGAAGSMAQIYLTRAYQLAPAALVSAVGYSAPVMSLGLGVALFDKSPGPTALAGCLLILASGIALPFLSVRRQLSDS
jgi:drug/metabolite transporter (DMT)-like permease